MTPSTSPLLLIKFTRVIKGANCCEVNPGQACRGRCSKQHLLQNSGGLLSLKLPGKLKIGLGGGTNGEKAILELLVNQNNDQCQQPKSIPDNEIIRDIYLPNFVIPDKNNLGLTAITQPRSKSELFQREFIFIPVVGGRPRFSKDVARFCSSSTSVQDISMARLCNSEIKAHSSLLLCHMTIEKSQEAYVVMSRAKRILFHGGTCSFVEGSIDSMNESINLLQTPLCVVEGNKAPHY
ncbi:4-hydroxy-3-methylbut-2-en-1-yl diphosphatesynthase, partial [Striga asiatica]